jgi:dTMP kinase
MNTSKSSKSSHMKKPFFITFEGPDGGGKSTQIGLLKEYFVKLGYEVVVTREPGGTVAGDRIRRVLLDKECGSLEAETEMFLMLAQRCEHFRKVIRPAVETGKVVLCDRYFDSSVAYQGFGRGIAPQKIKEVHQEFLGDFLPDATILLLISPEEGLERAKHNGAKQLDRIESENKGFHQRVYEAYEKLADLEPERFIKVFSQGTPEEIAEKIRVSLQRKFTVLSN